jgi:hypothetical protein
MHTEAADVPARDPHEVIAGMIESGDDSLGAGDDRDSEAVEAGNTSPRLWGFDVEEINRSYAACASGAGVTVASR